MKKIVFIFFIFSMSVSLSAQLVAKMEMKEPIPGICDHMEVYALIPSFKGQVEAFCSINEAEIVNRLNAEVVFVKENLKYKDKGMVGIIVNCKGQMIECNMSNNTKTPELDKQILTVFNSLSGWKAGTLGGKQVDSKLLYSFKIKKGVITFD